MRLARNTKVNIWPDLFAVNLDVWKPRLKSHVKATVHRDVAVAKDERDVALAFAPIERATRDFTIQELLHGLRGTVSSEPSKEVFPMSERLTELHYLGWGVPVSAMY